MFQRIQVGFHRSVVDTQELICGGHHVDTVGFAFRAFLVHELVNWLIHWSALQEDAHHQKECPAQGGRSPLGNAAAADIYLAGLVWRGVNARKGHQRFLGMKTAHISNFSHELWAESGANTKHLHHHRILRQRSRQGLQLPVDSITTRVSPSKLLSCQLAQFIDGVAHFKG